MMDVTYSYKVQTTVALGLGPFSSNNLTISILSLSMALIRAVVVVSPNRSYYNKLNITVHTATNLSSNNIRIRSFLQ